MIDGETTFSRAAAQVSPTLDNFDGSLSHPMILMPGNRCNGT
jgi:hypothetical protein